MKHKMNPLSIASIIFDFLVPIVWLIEALQRDEHYNANVFWIFLGMSFISQGITEYRFGKLISESAKSSKSSKFNRWFSIILGIAMTTVSIVKLALGRLY